MALWAPAQNLSVVFSANGSEARMRGMWRRRDSVVVRTASSEVSSSGGGEMAAYEEGQLERPNWAGETPLSRLVGAIISFKPLYSVLKLGARQVLIRLFVAWLPGKCEKKKWKLKRNMDWNSTAEKTNIPWREMTNEILESDVYKEMESTENPSVVYPDYYLNPFHAYDEGNLSWLAAAEAEAATMSMVRRATPDASSLEEAIKIVRGNWLQAIERHHLQYSGNSTIRDILDVGCSVGVSTRFLADKFPSAKVTGLDLSPYFLAVAQFKEKERASRKNPINWVHANGEDTGLPSKSFDIVSMAYVLHECPARAIVGLVREAFRLLRPGGTIALTDNSPKSKVLQELSPVLFTLMKSTEPFLDEYYLTDLEGRMREAGFVNVTTVLTDKRHRTVTGTVPL
ncbi:Demethylmenaquinone methyltransferase [Vitis vinifera]|uniref:Demethylmenaquinone methyltransferase n=1 Tax=Vitis vinifera TaxID=29760 RepID=A0A438EG72_VITVI|nr:Demethylmenaquinone methyltransferase [Vitis vinifera]